MPIPSPLSPSSILDLLLDAVFLVDAQGQFTYASAACERLLGYTPEEMVGRRMIDFVYPEDRPRTLSAAGQVMSGDPKGHFENRYLHKQGHAVHLMWSATWSDAEQLRIGVARDVTELRHAERLQAALYGISEAAHASEHLEALFEHLHQVIGTLLPAPGFSVALCQEADADLHLHFHADEHGIHLRGTTEPAGPHFHEVLRKGQTLLLSSDQASASDLASWQGLPPAGTSCWLGVPLVSGEDTRGVLALSSRTPGHRYTNKEADLLQYVATQVTTAIVRKQMQTQLLHAARHDHLTGLPNRSLLFDRLDTALARARRQRSHLSLLYLDLNGFKQINDQHGHAMGDALLSEVARRLTACLRESDTVARMGGDEFVILLERVRGPEDAKGVTEKIRAAIQAPMTLEGQPIHATLSVGHAHYPEDGTNARALLARADDAMYRNKRQRG